MAGSSKAHDQVDLVYPLLKLIEELVTEIHANKPRSLVLNLDSSLD